MNANDLISQWMGRQCTCVTEFDYDNIVNGIVQKTTYWGNCAMHGNGGVSIPWQTSDRRAVELLPVLVEKGYTWKLESNPRGFYFYVRDAPVIGKMFESIQPTIAQAITSAILELIEREKP